MKDSKMVIKHEGSPKSISLDLPGRTVVITLIDDNTLHIDVGCEDIIVSLNELEDTSFEGAGLVVKFGNFAD